MNRRIFVAVLLCFSANMSWAQAAPGNTFSADDIGVIDVNPQTQNILFRGDIPLDSNNHFVGLPTFVAGLQTQFKEFLNLHPSVQMNFPSQYIVVDIDMIGTKNTAPQVPNEFTETTGLPANDFARHEFLPNNPDQLAAGKIAYMWWQVMTPYNQYSQQYSPTDVVVNALDDAQQATDLPSLVNDQLYRLLNTKASVPLLIYFHCEDGENRTGTITMGYRLTYGGYSIYNPNRINQYTSFADAMNDTVHLNQDNTRQPDSYATTSARYYCLYLGKSSSFCLN